MVVGRYPKFDVKMMLSEKYTVSPRPSVSRPSSSIGRNVSKIRGCAFSIFEQHHRERALTA